MLSITEYVIPHAPPFEYIHIPSLNIYLLTTESITINQYEVAGNLMISDHVHHLFCKTA